MDNLERARQELRAAERDHDRSVRWLGGAVLVCLLAWVNLFLWSRHWLPVWIAWPLSWVLLVVGLIFLGIVVRWMWANRPWPRRRS